MRISQDIRNEAKAGMAQKAAGFRESGDPTMVNRLKEYLEEPEEHLPEQDYWVVASQYDDFYVTRAVAESIMRELERPLLRRWLRFTDVNGSAVRVLAKQIDQVREWTKDQRAADRQFRRARRLEDKADRRPWEDDD
jgi:hypothetical protein